MRGSSTPSVTTGAPPLDRVGRLSPTALAWLALALLLAGAAVFFYTQTRGTTLWFDEWQWVVGRRGNDLDAFLATHNGHLSLVPVAIYKLLFAVVGLDVYGPYRIMVIAAHLACVLLGFEYARRRVGPFIGLLAALLILFLGPAWQNVLWPFQVAWLISLGAGVGALLLLDRRDRAGDMAASALLALSLASSGLGAAIALGVAVDVLWGRRRWRDAWIVAVPLVLYGLWWLPYQDAHRLGELVDVPAFVANSAAASIAALVGLGGDTIPGEPGTLLRWGRPLAVVAAVLLVWRLVRLGRIPPRVVALLAILLSFWIATELSRGPFSSPYESRYLYVGGLFVVLLAVELARGASISWPVAAVLGLVAVAAAVSNIGTFRDAGRYVREQGQVTRAVLGAAEIGRPLLGPNDVLRELPGFPFLDVRAGSYFAAAKADGTPAATSAELVNQPWYARLAADRELIRVHDIALRRASPGASLGAAPSVDDVAGGTVARDGACVSFRPEGARATHDLHATVPPEGLRLTAEGGPAGVGVRRFGDSFQTIGRLAASAPATLRIGPDRSTQPWHLRVQPDERVTLCGLG